MCSSKCRDRVIAYAVLTLAAGAYALFAGKDLNWDLLNYHYYAGFSVFADRLQQDFFPATTASYLVPYAYAPLFLLIQGGVDDRVIVFVLAASTSTALWGIWEIGGLLVKGAREDGVIKFDRTSAYLSALVAAICPVFLTQLGTSFIDAPTAALVVWGYWLLLRSIPTGDWRHVAAGAVLIGIAVGLKQTNAIFALAGIVICLTAVHAPLRLVGVYGTFGVAAGLLVMAPWGYRLYEVFGNPVFPLLNEIFKSGQYPPVDHGSRHFRFIPDSFWEGVLRPLWMMSPESGVYTEPPSPDARYLSFFLLLTIACAIWAWRKSAVVSASVRGPVQFEPPRALRALTGSYLLSWTTWLIASGNGRYFISMALLLGPLIVGWIYAISGYRKWRIYAISSVGAITVALAVMGSTIRFAPVPWSETYFNVEVPATLKNSPILMISLDTQPAAFVTPYLHRNSSFVSAVGMHILDPDGPGWERVEDLVSKHAAVYFLLPAVSDESGRMTPPKKSYLTYLTARLGFEVDTEHCEEIRLHGYLSSDAKLNKTAEGGIEIGARTVPFTLFAACRGTRNDELRKSFLAQVTRINALFDTVVARCPKLFRPFGITEGFDENWRRFYVATDMVLYYELGTVRYRRFGMNKPRVVGTDEEILSGAFEFQCDRKRDPLLTLETA